LTSALKFQHRDEWTRVRARELTMDQYRSEGRITFDPAALNRAQSAALVWVLHMKAFQKLANSDPGDRIRSLDSQSFMEHPGVVVHAVTRHFGISLSSDRIEQAVSAGTKSSNAKAPGENYGLEQREQDYGHSRQQYGKEIDAGMEWAHKHFCALIMKSGPSLPLV